ncbi:MAG: hypothetical protein ACEQSQ_06190 [Candidatus Paceibacteria bacterium]
MIENEYGNPIYEIDDVVKCIDDSPLIGNIVSPPIVIGEEYVVRNIVLDKNYNQHLDLGLKSHFTFIRSWETNEELPQGDEIHWVSPIRVKFIK